MELRTNIFLHQIAPVAIVLMSIAGTSQAQTPAPPPLANGVLMRDSLGDTTEPKMALNILTLQGGAAAPVHSHAGVVFAYVLDGHLENQIDPEPPKRLGPDDFFHERPKQQHQMFRNLSPTEPVRVLIFQNTPTVITRSNTALQELLPELRDQEVVLTKHVLGPGSVVSESGSGSVFAYVLEGTLLAAGGGSEPKSRHAGEMFYSPPAAQDRTYRNTNTPERAELLVFHVQAKKN